MGTGKKLVTVHLRAKLYCVIETLEISNVISEKAPIAVRQAKQAIHKGLQMSLHDGMAFEIEAYNRTIKTDDRKEGIAAFNEKRKPNFKGQ